MADEVSSQSKPKEEVDLDEIEVSIVVLAKNAKQLSSSASFLTRRGWPTTVFSNVGQAVEAIAEQKPDLVLISLNHTSPSVAKMPDLLSTTFNIPSAVFVETHDTATQARLSKSASRFKIQGSASGPNLHRSIRKILAELLNISPEPSSGEGGSQTESITKPDSRRTASAEDDSSSKTIIQSSGPGATHGAGANLIKGEGYEDIDDSLGSDQQILSNGKYTMAKKKRRSLKQLAQELNPGAIGGMGAVGDGTERAATASSEPHSSASGSADGGTTAAQGLGTGGSATEGISPAGSREAPSAADMAGRLKRSLLGEKGTRSPSATDSAEAALEQGVEAALAQVCAKAAESEGKAVLRVGVVARVGVFPVNSATCPGYLVVASAIAESSRDELFREIQRKLADAFPASGAAHVEPGFWVNVPEVEFEIWVLEKAMFSVTLEHQSSEVMAAFFATEKPLPEVREMKEAGMLSVGIDEIATDHPVNFKAYLHLRQNKKYFLYLRNGRQFQPEQKERLRGRKVSDFYMKTVDKENLRMFLAASFLRESIRGILEAA